MGLNPPLAYSPDLSRWVCLAQPPASSSAEGWGAPGNAESTRSGAEQRARGCSRVRRRTGQLLLLKHLDVRLRCHSPPRSTTAFLWHLGRTTRRNVFKGNKRKADLLHLGATGKSSSWCASLTACVVREEGKGTWRCPRVRSCPLDLFFSSWRPSVSHCLGRECRDLLSGVTYLLTWQKRGACVRHPGSYPTPFFSSFLSFLISVVSILIKPLPFYPFQV